VKTYNLAIIGCGGVSSMHFDGYRAHPERVRVVAACDPSEPAVLQRQQQYGFPSAFDAVDQLCAEADFDVAVVCTPTPVREGVIRTLTAAGKPLYCEKPLADSLDEAQRIVAHCEERGVPLAVDQNFRYHYPFHVARQILAAARLGRPLQVIHRDLMFRKDQGWRVKCERHALSVMGVHWLDGFRYLLADEAESLLCRTASSPAIQCAGETEASMQIRFTGGATVTYVQSFASAIPSTETLILGEHGTLRLEYGRAALYDHRRGRDPVEEWTNPYFGPGKKPESCFAGLETLLTALEHGTAAPNSGRDNLRTIALLDAAYRSAADGGIVTLQAPTHWG
jgi:predicted dehydrogenase